MTTYAAFVAALAALDIDGVTTAYTTEIDYGDTVDLPISFPRLPSGGTNEETMTTCIDDGRLRIGELVVLVQAVGQGTTAENFTATLTMIDSVETAVKSFAPGTAFFEWELTAGLDAVPGYWAVVLTVTGKE